MTEAPKSSYCWVFTEDTLDEVAAQFAADQTDDTQSEAFLHYVLLDFFHSPQVVNRGIRRGGNTASDAEPNHD